MPRRQTETQRIGHLAPPHANDGRPPDVAELDVAADLGLEFRHEEEGMEQGDPPQQDGDEGVHDQHAVHAKVVGVVIVIVVLDHGIVAVGVAVVVRVAGGADAVGSEDGGQNKTDRGEG